MVSEEKRAEDVNNTQPDEVAAASEPQNEQESPQTTAEATNEKPDQSTGDEAVAPGGQEKESDERPSDVEALKPGMRLKGQVRNIVDFGAFIDIGVGRDGLAHISTLRKAGIDKSIQVGDTIDVQIRRVDMENNRISLTIPGAGKGSKTSLRELQAGSTVNGRVVRLVDFGAFVDIGAQTDGLLHISQMPYGYVNHPSDVLKVGDEVEVRIQDVDVQRRRISLTMKDVADEEDESFVPQAGEPDEDMPTAFQVVWERALAEQRRQEK